MYFWYLEDRLFHVPDDSVLTPDTDIGIFLAQFTYVLTKITESYGRTVLLPRLTRMLEWKRYSLLVAFVAVVSIVGW